MKIFGGDRNVLMEIASLRLDGDKLSITGKIMGTLPMKAVINPRDLRSFLLGLGFRNLVKIGWRVLTARQHE